MTVYLSGSGSLTAEQLAEYSGSISAYFRRNDIRRAAVICGKSPLVYAAVNACDMARVCFIPVDEALPEKRREMITQDADEVFFDSRELPGQPGWTDLCGVISGETPNNAGTVSSGGHAHAADPGEAPAYRIYTSGTTGEPKGIEVTRGNLSSFLGWFGSIPAIAETKPRSVLNQAMFSFDLSVADLWYSLRENIRLTVMERRLFMDLPAMFRRMSESGAELAVLTPAFAELCLCDSGFSRELLPELRVIFFCGETLRPATAAKLFGRFPRVRILNAYGPTECCCAVTAAEITPDMTRGAALPTGDLSHTAGGIHIKDGEIVITGASVARYARCAKCSGSSAGGFGEYRGERCFFTGDRGSVSGGMLWFGGRLDRQVKLMGYRIEPEDIENNILKIPGVNQAAVSVRNGRLSALVAAVGTTPEEIRRRLAELVPAYMLPGRITITDVLPVSGNFKLRRD